MDRLNGVRSQIWQTDSEEVGKLVVQPLDDHEGAGSGP